MKKTLFLLSAGIFFLQLTYAAAKDSNVVISGASDQYIFDYIKKGNTVNIKQEMKTTYQCMNFRTVIPVAEFYDDKTSIDDVKIYVDGAKAKNVLPKYEYYSVDNIFYSDAHICYFKLPLEKKEATAKYILKRPSPIPGILQPFISAMFTTLSIKQFP